MGNFRFYRRVGIFPGLSVNLSKSGPSLTLGVRGAHVTLGRSGVRKTVGIPGTGIYYTSHQGYHSGVHSAHVEQPIGPEQQTRAHRIADLIFLAILLGLVLLIGIGIGSAVSRPP